MTGMGLPRWRRLRRLPLLLILSSMPATALVLDGHSRVHAVIGQPLSVVLPLSFSGGPTGGVDVRVMPAPGLADAEEEVAESVTASYDAAHSLVRLSTPQRVLVPAISLHLVISTGSFVVNRDFDVLVDLPDFNREYDRAPATAEAGAGSTATAAAEGVAPSLLIVPGEGQPASSYGDSSVRDVALRVDAPRPQAGAATAPRPAPRPDSYAVRSGDTLSGIAAQLAKARAVPAAPLGLALYEANPQAFPPTAPEHPIPGKQLLVPEPLVVRSEPAERVSAFGQYLKHPLGTWQLPSFVSFGEAAVERPVAARAQAQFFRPLLTVLLVALLLGALAEAGRRFAPRLAPQPGLGEASRWSREALLPAWRQLMQTAAEQMHFDWRRLLPQKPAVPPDAAPEELPEQLPQAVANETLPEREMPPADSGLEQETRRLRQMLIEQPWRSDLRYQLAQRLYKAGDARGFGDMAAPLKQVLNGESWQRVSAMGRQLLPGDARFGD
jgi:hypothetical protein